MSLAPSSYDAQTLLELYKIAVEEYRFEVRLGWDRMKCFLVLLNNAGVLEQYVEHGEQAQRSNGGPIVCFDRQVVRKAG